VPERNRHPNKYGPLDIQEERSSTLEELRISKNLTSYEILKGLNHGTGILDLKSMSIPLTINIYDNNFSKRNLKT
jgi:hypothetical protein